MKKKNDFLVYLIAILVFVISYELFSDWEHFKQGLIGASYFVD